MKNYVTPLWMLFFSALLNNISGIFPDVLSTILSLLGSVLGLIALFQLADRNWRLEKTKTFTIALVAVTAAVFLLVFVLPALAIVGAIAMAVLGILCMYNQLHGLADMADEAGNRQHGERLRQLFTFYVIMALLPLLSGIPGVAILLVIAALALTVYQLILYYRSIQIEQAFEGAR